MRLLKVLLTVLTMPIYAGLTFASSTDIKLEALVETSRAGYVGEAIEYTVSLKSSRNDIADVRVVRMPEFPENCKVIRGTVSNRKPRLVEEKGKSYYCWTVLRVFIIPESSGKINVGEGEFIAFLPVERIVNDFFWGARRIVDYEEMAFKSEARDIKISNLPAVPKGESFNGGVGSFNVEGWFPPGVIRVRKEAIAVFTISGFGSLENLKLPDIYKSFSDGCSLKEIEQNESQSQKGGKLFSEVTLTCKFIPETEDGQISPVSFVFFNPETKKYEVKSSYPLHWNGSETKEKKSSTKLNEAIEI